MSELADDSPVIMKTVAKVVSSAAVETFKVRISASNFLNYLTFFPASMYFVPVTFAEL
jgi:hypothetical protein